MNRHFVVATARLSLLALGVALAGCTSVGSLFGGDKVDYRKQAAKTAPLDVPPDLTQLSRNSRFQNQGGVVSASTQPGAGATVATAAPTQTVALGSVGEARVERQGNQRWLVVPGTPEQVWPKVRAFWLDGGFTLVNDNAEAGVLETDWQENRTKLPQDFIRRTIGRVFDGMYDTGERDRYRTRVERGSNGVTEIYVSHRGLEEAYTDQSKTATVWRPRPSDPALEAAVLAQMLAKFGTPAEAARSAVANAVEVAPRARALSGRPAATLEVDEAFDRAWRRVGLALDRSGFTVEDRDRAAGLYFVRYVTAPATKEEPGFFGKLFGGGGSSAAASAPQRYRISVTASGEKTLVAVLAANGSPERSDTAQRIVGQLVGELR